MREKKMRGKKGEKERRQSWHRYSGVDSETEKCMRKKSSRVHRGRDVRDFRDTQMPYDSRSPLVALRKMLMHFSGARAPRSVSCRGEISSNAHKEQTKKCESEEGGNVNRYW